MPQKIIPAKLAQGLLPRDRPLKTWAGTGRNDTCEGCGQPITPAQMEHEMDLPNARTLRMHASCAEIWKRAIGN